MKDSLLDLLICPLCKGKLVLSGARRIGNEIEAGTLTCGCGKSYPIKNSIPRFVRSDDYASNFSFQWTLFKKTQLDSFNNTNISENRFRAITGLRKEQLDGKLILDAGCGMGRFLEIAAKSNAQVVGIDISFAVDAAKSNLQRHSNIHLIQADIFNAPLMSNKFDFIYSIGVLHNTPDPKRAFQCIAPLLAKGGGIAIWVAPRSKFPWLPTATQLARFFTPHMRSGFLFKMVRIFVPMCLPLVRMPIVGPLLKGKLIPVCDYKGQLPLNKRQLREWSILDTFNILSPRYLHPSMPQKVKSWFVEVGLSNIIVDSPAVTVRARWKP